VTDGPRYTSLRDYLRVLRERRLLIVACVLVCAGAALALSVREDAIYQAESALTFQAASEESDLLGTPAPERLTSGERAAQGAEIVGRPTVVERVQRDLRGRVSPEEAASAVTARVDARTNLVLVQARSTSPQRAALLADAYATAAFRDAVERARLRFRRAATEVRRQFRAVPRRSRDATTRAIYADRITRLNVLARTAIPVQVVRRAAVPADPVSPKPVRNTLLGALLGLTLGIVLAFARDVLDRRLRGVAEITDQLDWPVLGHVREQAMGRVATGTNGHKPLEPLDLESFRILRANLAFLDVDDPPKVVLVTSAMPAEGKTTVATSLAYASAVSGRNTVLVECDLRRPMIAERLGLERAPGLIDHLLGESELADAAREISQAASGGNGNGNGKGDGAAAPAGVLTVIPAGRPTARAGELLASRRFGAALATLVEHYDAVILDASPLLSVADTIELLPRVDGILLCVRAGQTTRDQVAAARQAIERVPGRSVGVVVTGLRARDEIDYGYYSYAYAQDA
jgi:Mrp family chromosome partitioning ATPase/capsular polysaccharide biosynthesis protein